MQARHEYKVSLNTADYLILRSRMHTVLQRDPHVDESGQYLVRSLYFDSPKDTALREKINGVNRREKFRLRCYNGDVRHINLEKKSKRNGLCYKQNVTLSEQAVQAILHGNVEWMLASKQPLLTEFYSKWQTQGLRPKTIVEYQREPYVCSTGNVRITFDKDIRSGLFATDFLQQQLPLIRTMDEGGILIEVKYDAFLPEYIRKLLQIDNRQAASFSKYALCRVYG